MMYLVKMVKRIKAPSPYQSLSKGDIVCIYDTETISLCDKRVWKLCMKIYKIGEESQPIVSLFERFAHTDVDETSLKWHADQRKISTSDVDALIRNGRSPDTICALRG